MTTAIAGDARGPVMSGLRRVRSLRDLGDMLSSRWSGTAPSLAIALVVVLVAIALISVLVLRQIGQHHQQVQRERVIGAIDSSRARLGESTTRAANRIKAGSSAPQRALSGPDTADSGHAIGYVAQADAGGVAQGAAWPPPIARLADALRAEPGKRPRTLTDFVVVDDRVSVAAVGAVEEGGIPSAFVATLQPLDDGSLAKRLPAVDDLRFEPDAPADARDTHALLDSRGRIVGWASWQPGRPPFASVLTVVPYAALLGACLAGFAAFAMRQTQRERSAAGGAGDVDPLTGIANRAHSLHILERALAARDPDQVVMLALLDLDNFEDVNDSFGHHGGDMLLAAIAQRLKAAVPPSGIAGRLGGNEFAIVASATTVARAVEIANDALNALGQPFAIAGQTVQIGACVGIALAPRDGESCEELVRRADLALRAAKKQGRGSIVTFELPLEQAFHDRRFIIRGLRRAVAEDGLELRYQPIVTADGKRVVGVEALLRWRHRSRGEIPPEVFIPIAEQSGLMGQLGEFVVRRALADAARWKNLYVAINISPVQMRDPALVELVAAALRQTGTAASRVVFEITENVLIDEPEKAIRRLEKLRALGVKIALDDFGSGYSSLRYLQRFPIDKLKIDRSFVASLDQSARGGVIIQAIIALGHALGLSVLVEGIETEEQKLMMRLAGSDEMQGHLFAKPLLAAEIDLINLRAGTQRPASGAAAG
jgi:diguanylate cyclase (GGDEF)-like protein